MLHAMAELAEHVFRNIEWALADEVHAHAFGADQAHHLFYFFEQRLGRVVEQQVRLVEKDYQLRFFNIADFGQLFKEFGPDKRIIFAIPYEGEFTLIGTTDVEHDGAIGVARIDASETSYLCEQASRYFERAVAPADVVWSYSGVRPLLDDESGDPSAVTRDYSLELDVVQAPLLSVWGGKITTFRKLAEEAADLLAAPLGTTRGAWTAGQTLPGGDLASKASTDLMADFERCVDALRARHPAMPAPLCRRLARGYGSRADGLLSQGLGTEVAPGLFEAELHYLHRHEWARSADDVLWRRTKLGLHLTLAERGSVDAWCRAHWGDVAATTTTSHAASAMEPSWN